jgi:uncharacterized protein (TIGR03083 family)
VIRSVRPADRSETDAVRRLVLAAFGGNTDVPQLVDELRVAPGYQAQLDLVAEDPDGVIVGHTMLTAGDVIDPGSAAVTGQVAIMAPLSVRPDHQRRGIGRALTQRAVQVAGRAGFAALVLEGNPAVYRTYGLTPVVGRGVDRPSPTVPLGAFQHQLTGVGVLPRGRLRYPPQFWGPMAAGVPEPARRIATAEQPWLYRFASYAGWIEALATCCDPATPIPDCAGWTMGELVRHVTDIHQLVEMWITSGARPRRADVTAASTDLARYMAGWRNMYQVLDSDPDGPAATWAPWDDTLGFWWRRMVHEVAIHAYDAVAAAGVPGQVWTVDQELALDGVDEALRLFLGVRTGREPFGAGQRVSLRAADRVWTVGMHGDLVLTVSGLAEPGPSAVVSAEPADLYRWVWGRGGDLEISGDRDTVAELRRALDHATE